MAKFGYAADNATVVTFQVEGEEILSLIDSGIIYPYFPDKINLGRWVDKGGEIEDQTIEEYTVIDHTVTTRIVDLEEGLSGHLDLDDEVDEPENMGYNHIKVFLEPKEDNEE